MQDKTIVRFYRGCFSMGIVISVSYNNDRVIFDFGAPFNPLSEVYDGHVIPRNRNHTKDELFLGRIPAVDGVFPKADLAQLPVISYEDSSFNTAILICHLHLDHMSEINLIHPSVPVYIGKEGHQLYQLLQQFEDPQGRKCTPFDYGDTLQIGCIKVKTFYNNHPCPGSASFLIQTPDQTILYSGDIRFHGTRYKQAWQAVDEIAKTHVDLLIVDATTTSPSEFIYNPELEKQYRVPNREFLKGEIKEQDIYDQLIDSLTHFDGIGIFNQYPRDVEMLQSMAETAKRCHRTLVLEPMYAAILYRLKGIKSTVFYPDTARSFVLENELRENMGTITMDEIKKNPSQYLLQNSYENILSLIDLDSVKGNYYHLLGEPLVKESPQWKTMLTLIERLNWQFISFINLYSFSHAYPNHLAEVVKTVNAATVVAVHSKHPENLNPINSIHIIPEEGVDYILQQGKLVKA